VASFLERPADMMFVLDQILAAGADPASPFFGLVDGTRVAMTGHSFGGMTTFRVAAMDPRITVAVAMAPATFAGASFELPSLIMLGNADGVVNNPAARTAYTASQEPKLLVEVEHSGHYTFSDGCFPGPDCNPPTTLTQPAAVRTQRRCSDRRRVLASSISRTSRSRPQRRRTVNRFVKRVRVG
jgi:predicted dienelactone hydrolase